MELSQHVYSIICSIVPFPGDISHDYLGKLLLFPSTLCMTNLPLCGVPCVENGAWRQIHQKSCLRFQPSTLAKPTWTVPVDSTWFFSSSGSHPLGRQVIQDDRSLLFLCKTEQNISSLDWTFSRAGTWSRVSQNVRATCCLRIMDQNVHFLLVKSKVHPFPIVEFSQLQYSKFLKSSASWRDVIRVSWFAPPRCSKSAWCVTCSLRQFSYVCFVWWAPMKKTLVIWFTESCLQFVFIILA